VSSEQPEINGGQGWSAGRQIDGLERDVRRARLAQAAHFDALVEIRDAQTLRLAALHEDLRKKTAADPRLAALLPLQMESGFPPRLWIDNNSYVTMEPDPRTFRLVRQVTSGHETVLETRELSEMVAKVRECASHSLIESQRNGTSAESGNGKVSSQIVMAWLTGFTFGVLGLLILGILTGRITF
jgi:hypothetical protein